MNFSEQLAYWYLRLNGFFPLADFVLHPGEGRPSTSDADLVAVRFPHVFEEIGGREDDWDPRFAGEWGIKLTGGSVALIVEVKSGRWDANDLKGANLEWKTRTWLGRTGMIPQSEVEKVVAQLRDKRLAEWNGAQFARLLICTNGLTRDIPWNVLDLEAAEAFILDRMKKYPVEKFGGRLFFPGDLIQYLAWKGGKH
jgi:hypothetical protein